MYNHIHIVENTFAWKLDTYFADNKTIKNLKIMK